MQSRGGGESQAYEFRLRNLARDFRLDSDEEDAAAPLAKKAGSREGDTERKGKGKGNEGNAKSSATGDALFKASGAGGK